MERRTSLLKGKRKVSSVNKFGSYYRLHNKSLNSSIFKETLKTNNRSLACALAETKEELKKANDALLQAVRESQEKDIKLNTLQRVAGLKNDQIEREVNKRFQERLHQIDEALNKISSNVLATGDSLTEAMRLCEGYYEDIEDSMTTQPTEKKTLEENADQDSQLPVLPESIEVDEAEEEDGKESCEAELDLDQPAIQDTVVAESENAAAVTMNESSEAETGEPPSANDAKNDEDEDRTVLAANLTPDKQVNQVEAAVEEGDHDNATTAEDKTEKIEEASLNSTYVMEELEHSPVGTQEQLLSVDKKNQNEKQSTSKKGKKSLRIRETMDEEDDPVGVVSPVVVQANKAESSKEIAQDPLSMVLMPPPSIPAKRNVKGLKKTVAESIKGAKRETKKKPRKGKPILPSLSPLPLKKDIYDLSLNESIPVPSSLPFSQFREAKMLTDKPSDHAAVEGGIMKHTGDHNQPKSVHYSEQLAQLKLITPAITNEEKTIPGMRSRKGSSKIPIKRLKDAGHTPKKLLKTPRKSKGATKVIAQEEIEEPEVINKEGEVKEHLNDSPEQSLKTGSKRRDARKTTILKLTENTEESNEDDEKAEVPKQSLKTLRKSRTTTKTLVLGTAEKPMESQEEKDSSSDPKKSPKTMRKSRTTTKTLVLETEKPVESQEGEKGSSDREKSPKTVRKSRGATKDTFQEPAGKSEERKEEKKNDATKPKKSPKAAGRNKKATKTLALETAEKVVESDGEKSGNASNPRDASKEASLKTKEESKPLKVPATKEVDVHSSPASEIRIPKKRRLLNLKICLLSSDDEDDELASDLKRLKKGPQEEKEMTEKNQTEAKRHKKISKEIVINSEKSTSETKSKEQVDKETVPLSKSPQDVQEMAQENETEPKRQRKVSKEIILNSGKSTSESKEQIDKETAPLNKSPLDVQEMTQENQTEPKRQRKVSKEIVLNSEKLTSESKPKEQVEKKTVYEKVKSPLKECVNSRQISLAPAMVAAADSTTSSPKDGRRSRRAASKAVSYKEPSLSSKLRRGDPISTTIYSAGTSPKSSRTSSVKSRVSKEKPPFDPKVLLEKLDTIQD